MIIDNNCHFHQKLIGVPFQSLTKHHDIFPLPFGNCSTVIPNSCINLSYLCVQPDEVRNIYLNEL